jgi:hypothetical protein
MPSINQPTSTIPGSGLRVSSSTIISAASKTTPSHALCTAAAARSQTATSLRAQSLGRRPGQASAASRCIYHYTQSPLHTRPAASPGQAARLREPPAAAPTCASSWAPATRPTSHLPGPAPPPSTHQDWGAIAAAALDMHKPAAGRPGAPTVGAARPETTGLAAAQWTTQTGAPARPGTRPELGSRARLTRSRRREQRAPPRRAQSARPAPGAGRATQALRRPRTL